VVRSGRAAQVQALRSGKIPSVTKPKDRRLRPLGGPRRRSPGATTLPLLISVARGARTRTPAITGRAFLKQTMPTQTHRPTGRPMCPIIVIRITGTIITRIVICSGITTQIIIINTTRRATRDTTRRADTSTPADPKPIRARVGLTITMVGLPVT